MKKLALLALSAVMFTACGDNKKKNHDSDDTLMDNHEVVTDMNHNDNEAIVDLSGTDQMTFDKNEIRVKQGQKVKLTLHHTGTMDKKVMGHNFVLLKKGTDVSDFATKASASVNNNYIPENSMDVIVHTDVIGGGETTTIVFDAPEEGTYDFICSFPGHYAMMKGKFIVE